MAGQPPEASGPWKKLTAWLAGRREPAASVISARVRALQFMLESSGRQAAVPGKPTSLLLTELEQTRLLLSSWEHFYQGAADAVAYRSVAEFYDSLRTALAARTMTDLIACELRVPGPEFPSLFPPAVLSAVSSLRQLSGRVERAHEVTAPLNIANTLLEVNEQLVLLTHAQYELRDQKLGSGLLVSRLIAHWADILTVAGQRRREAEQRGPIANPYVIGNPVRGELFVGREDILARLTELWSQPGTCPSVVLYGHRRMGKSSILHNLDRLRLNQPSLVVDCNLQRIGWVSSTGELLYALAMKIYDAASFASLGPLEEPKEERFLKSNPYLALDRFLSALERVRAGRRIIVTLDEFELLEKQMIDGRLDPALLSAFRALFQTYPFLVMVFAGLHKLEELRHDYWSPLFGSVSAIEVSFLSRPAAEKLITAPAPDFALDYDREATARIYALTSGQPYLIQLICHCLVAAYNRNQLKFAGALQPRILRSDVDAVIAEPELFRDGTAYFRGVFAQIEPGPGRQLLAALASAPDGESGPGGGIALEELAARSGLSLAEVQLVIGGLVQRAIVRSDGTRAQFAVELLRRWAESEAAQGSAG